MAGSVVRHDYHIQQYARRERMLRHNNCSTSRRQEQRAYAAERDRLTDLVHYFEYEVETAQERGIWISIKILERYLNEAEAERGVLVNDFVEKNLGFVLPFYRRFVRGNPGCDKSEVMSICTERLCLAALEYNPAKGEFGTIAGTLIRNALKDHFIHLGRDYVGFVNGSKSLDEPLFFGELEEDGYEARNWYEAHEDNSFARSSARAERADLQRDIEKAVVKEELSDRDWEILRLLTVGSANGEKIGESLNITRAMVSKSNIRSLRRLRDSSSLRKYAPDYSPAVA